MAIPLLLPYKTHWVCTNLTGAVGKDQTSPSSVVTEEWSQCTWPLKQHEQENSGFIEVYLTENVEDCSIVSYSS